MLGLLDGEPVGLVVGLNVNLNEGENEGLLVAAKEGSLVGLEVVGIRVREKLGILEVGDIDGTDEGFVGSPVGN